MIRAFIKFYQLIPSQLMENRIGAKSYSSPQNVFTLDKHVYSQQPVENYPKNIPTSLPFLRQT